MSASLVSELSTSTVRDDAVIARRSRVAALGPVAQAIEFI
jgi:hypothetical protein